MAQDNDTATAAKDNVKRVAGAQKAAADQTTEAVRGTVIDSTETFRRLTEDTMGRFSQMFGLGAGKGDELQQQTSRNLDAMVRSSSVLMEGYQSIYQEWLDFVQRSYQQNLSSVTTLMGCRTAQDLAAAQSDLFKTRMQDLLNSTARLSELTAKVAGDAVDRIDERRRA